MKEILIFAGTTEGRRLSECLAASGICNTLCVATRYGEFVLREHPLVKVHQGRMNRKEIREFIEKGDFKAVVDATHPYADEVTENIRLAMEGIEIPYIRLKRELSVDKAANEKGEEGIIYFDSHEACAGALEKTEGNILLTTGSKDLGKYCACEGLKSRLYVRALPGMDSLSLCMEQGIRGKQIIAMQGPFTEMMNEAMIYQYGISCLVTKQSGKSGGFPEKLQAAKKAGIPLFVVGHKGEDEGCSFTEVCHKLGKLCGQEIRADNETDDNTDNRTYNELQSETNSWSRNKTNNGLIDETNSWPTRKTNNLSKNETNSETDNVMRITLAGIGMGSNGSLTKEAARAIEKADILLGAERMLEAYRPAIEKKAYYQAKQIIPYLKEVQKRKIPGAKVVILFSGDTGFYSGCQSVYAALEKEIRGGALKASIRILPGISSVAYLAACIGETYEDAAVLSMHGKELYHLVHRIREKEKTYVLTSGLKDVHKLGKTLVEAGMADCEIVTGHQLSYEEQQIKRLTPKACLELEEEGLYTCFIRNPNPIGRRLTHGMGDEEFIRGGVPMTKEEVREVSVCKLKLRQNAVVYDIGSGTGSVAVETAGLSHDIRVYAIEQKKEALALIAENQKKFQLDNITIVETKAPKGLRKLPKATHAFIGGSGGCLKEIVQALYESNPHMRVVINAISMETICEIKEILSMHPIENEEIVQIQADRAKKAGGYHLMTAENPVWICAFDFAGEKK